MSGGREIWRRAHRSAGRPLSARKRADGRRAASLGAANGVGTRGKAPDCLYRSVESHLTERQESITISI